MSTSTGRTITAAVNMIHQCRQWRAEHTNEEPALNYCCSMHLSNNAHAQPHPGVNLSDDCHSDDVQKEAHREALSDSIPARASAAVTSPDRPIQQERILLDRCPCCDDFSQRCRRGAFILRHDKEDGGSLSPSR